MNSLIVLAAICAPGVPLEGLDLMKARHRIEVSQREISQQDRALRSAMDQERQQDETASGPKKVVTTPDKPARKPKQRRPYVDTTPVWIVEPPMMPQYWIGPPIR